jgi:hypothetical protein
MRGRRPGKASVQTAMRSPPSIVIVAALIMAGCSRGPLAFQLPAGWNAEHQKPGGFHCYTLTAAAPQNGVLVLSQWPSPNRPEEMPLLVRQMAEGFLRQPQQSSDFRVMTRQYRVERFAGRGCQGSYAVFWINSGGTNALEMLFMMSVDGRVWNGEFTGSSNGCMQAFAVLKSVRKHG